MKPQRNMLWIFAGILTLVLVLAFLIYDTPTEVPAKIIVRYTAAPYPEEDTMHYITKEGVLIIYAQETPHPD